MDVVLAGLVMRAAIWMREGDTPVVRPVRATSPNPALLPTDWIGNHVGAIYNNLGVTIGALSIIVSDGGDDDLAIAITVVDSDDLPAGEHTWDARQTSGEGIGLVRFAPAQFVVEGTVS
jgi:hypothetical protein